MKQIKAYLKDWNLARFIKLVMASLLYIAYFHDKEPAYLFVGLILSTQAVFNLSCPGGSCSTGMNKNTKPVMEIKKYEPEK